MMTASGTCLFVQRDIKLRKTIQTLKIILLIFILWAMINISEMHCLSLVNNIM